jgi:hypothetical protein
MFLTTSTTCPKNPIEYYEFGVSERATVHSCTQVGLPTYQTTWCYILQERRFRSTVYRPLETQPSDKQTLKFS